ncbi:MAG: ABC transporter substrate-binding protein [Rhodocyclaceae bacterium]|jgi:ABC-type amino acid transport substrate-binding protein|nr:ABC transporter substrate-binding protein [Rhodocyclaceae bacterium]
MHSCHRLARGLAGGLAILFCTLVSAVGDAPGVPSSRLDKVLQSGEVRVCVWPDYYGISFRNPKSGALVGIDVDMAGELARDLGVRLNFVESSFARLIEDVTRDHCDVAMFAIGVTPQRQQALRFTRPHLVSDIYAVTTRSNRRIRSWDDIDRPGVVVAVARGTLHEPVMREKLQQATLEVLDTPHAREQAVASGRADVFMSDYPYSRRMLDNADWARLVAPPQAYHLTPYAYALAPGDDAWFERLEDFVRTVKQDGRLRAAAERHGLSAIVQTD